MATPQSTPRFTYGDYVQWKGDERYELIDGVVHQMSPAPSRRHQELVTEIVHQIRSQIPRSSPCRAYASPFDVRLPSGDEPDAEVETVVQPDVVVVCDPVKLDDAGCRGAPDWVIEVSSPSSSVRDRVDKVALYRRVGVREYWLVDPTASSVSVWLDGREPAAEHPLDGVLEAQAVPVRIDFGELRD